MPYCSSMVLTVRRAVGRVLRILFPSTLPHKGTIRMRLTLDEREICLRIATQGLAHRRRAKGLLASGEGATAEQAGECAGFPVRRIRYWEKLFRERRLGIFPERLIEEIGVESARPGEEAARVPGVEALPAPVRPPHHVLQVLPIQCEAFRRQLGALVMAL